MVRAARQGEVDKWRGPRFRTASRDRRKDPNGRSQAERPEGGMEGIERVGDTGELDRGSIEGRITE